MITKRKLRGGLEANIHIVADIIGKQIGRGKLAPQIRELAEDIVSNVPERNKAGEIKAIHNWLLTNARFTRDPRGVELMESPQRLVYEYRKRGKILADCESAAALHASLLGSIGHRVRAVLMDTNPLSRNFSHVIAQVYHSGQWVDLDASEEGRIGWSPKHTRRLVIDPQ
ncbi:MAG: hypothetical protein DDT26_01203 [Dehalococcoidia bacterium]|nr:hypothetical protein [Chloroflexota bacterium]